jgi:glutamine synthetase
MIIAEYLWLDADNNFRSKIRVMDENNNADWNFDGSSTNQATTESSEVILKVVYNVNHPFLDGRLYLCATYDINDRPLSNTYYEKATDIFNSNLELKPWFGLEQEYFIFDKYLTINSSNNSNINNSNIYYCSPINQDQDEVKISMEHLEACIKAGINVSGNNAEVVQHQWEFQVGPVEGINAGHQLMVARYLLNRIAAKYYKVVNYHPKPIQNVNGSGCHINFSTKPMREENGLDIIMNSIEKLKNNHDYHMANYGQDNKMRMTGHHETASYDKFNWGIGSRNTSVRIGYDTYKNKKGYFEDRRPASNIDPYLATSMIFQTCCL